ncbi:MAG TPA: 30S ribosomal protein S2 [Anaerolineae bacterium]|nr:30S ribosomal protein S2 [Anaerolineae bacterium]
MAVVSMKALLETGVHFGHRTRKWNPRMKSYIFTERNGIHIIDLQQTLEALETVYAIVRDTVAAGKRILFIGTKRQAQETIELEAKRCRMPYVNARWLGGTLTNWRTIRSRIDELETLERRRDSGEFERLTKKEAMSLTRRIDKLEARLGGIREMVSVPDLLFVVDVRREETAIHEANLLNIPVIALVDTNCDPTHVDYVIPSNDDAIRAIKLMTSKIADAVLEGLAIRKDEEEELVAEGLPLELEALAAVEMTDEELLGEATLAKLMSGEFDEKSAPDELEIVDREDEDELEIEVVDEEDALLLEETEVAGNDDEMEVEAEIDEAPEGAKEDEMEVEAEIDEAPEDAKEDEMEVEAEIDEAPEDAKKDEMEVEAEIDETSEGAKEDEA